MSEPRPEAKTISITLKCMHCEHKFSSPIFMTPYRSFSTATLVGNLAQCPRCRQMTGCDKEHFLARFEGGGFLGNLHL